MRKKRKYYFSVTEEQIRQAALELERQENMDLEQEIAEANAWAEANHIVRRPFPELPQPKRKPVRQILRPRREATIHIAKKSRFKPYIQLAAVFIIVLFGGWYTQTDAVQGMRLDLVNLFTTEIRDKGTIELKGQGEWNGFYVPTYLPPGFTLKETSSFSTIYIQTFTLPQTNQRINLTQTIGTSSSIYKDENFTEIIIQNMYTAILYRQNDEWNITWYDDQNICVSVSGNISLDEGLIFINNLKWSQK